MVVGLHRTAGHPGLRAAGLSRAQFPVDARILAIRSGLIFLGGRGMGASSPGRLSVDAGILGLARRSLCVERRILGASRGLLWRRELWLWVRRRLRVQLDRGECRRIDSQYLSRDGN